MRLMVSHAIADRIAGEKPGVVRAATVAAAVGAAVAAGTYKLLRSAE